MKTRENAIKERIKVERQRWEAVGEGLVTGLFFGIVKIIVLLWLCATALAWVKHWTGLEHLAPLPAEQTETNSRNTGSVEA